MKTKNKKLNKDQINEISVIEAANKLNVSNRSIIIYIRSKKIKATKVGKKYCRLDLKIFNFCICGKRIVNNKPYTGLQKNIF